LNSIEIQLPSLY